MIALLFKLTREVCAAALLCCFILFALVVFCAVPKGRDALEEIE